MNSQMSGGMLNPLWKKKKVFLPNELRKTRNADLINRVKIFSGGFFFAFSSVLPFTLMRHTASSAAGSCLADINLCSSEYRVVSSSHRRLEKKKKKALATLLDVHCSNCPTKLNCWAVITFLSLSLPLSVVLSSSGNN